MASSLRRKLCSLTNLCVRQSQGTRLWTNDKILRTFCTSPREHVLSGEEIKFDYLDGHRKGIAVVAINRPEAKNSMSLGLLKVLGEVLDLLSQDTETRVTILKSNVPGIFCAGADLKERAKMKESYVPILLAKAQGLLQQLSEVPMPTIVALDGHALGGGLEIALCCDLLVAAHNAKIGLPETKLAIIPGGGGTQRLTRLLGIRKAKELIFTGRAINGEEAGNIGLANYSVEQNETKDAAYQRSLLLADEILSNGPIALRMAKTAINKGIQVDLTSGLAIEKLCYAQVIPTKDRIEGLQAFKEKRKPQYTGE